MTTITIAPSLGAKGSGRYGAGLAILATIFFMWGFISVLNDVLVPHLKSVFELNYTETLLVQFVFFSTYFVMALPGAKLIEWIGYKHTIAVGLAVTGVGALLFVPAATLVSYALFLSGLFVLASGITVLQVAANPYVAVIGPPETAASRLTLVQAFNSLGTAVAPAFGGVLILGRSVGGTAASDAILTHTQRMSDALAVRAPYLGISLLLFVLAVVIAMWRLPVPASQNLPTDHLRDSVWRHGVLVIGIGAIFLYVGAEIAVGSFLINYISSVRVGGTTYTQASFYVTLFWTGAMTGRFLGAVAMRFVSPALLLGIQSFAAAVLLVLSISTSGHLALWAIVLVGLMNSIMFPTIFSLAIAGLGHLTQRASGLLIMAIIGGAVIPMLQAFIADGHGIRIAFLVPAACYLYVLYFAWVCGHRSPVAKSV